MVTNILTLNSFLTKYKDMGCSVEYLTDMYYNAYLNIMGVLNKERFEERYGLNDSVYLMLCKNELYDEYLSQFEWE